MLHHRYSGFQIDETPNVSVHSISESDLCFVYHANSWPQLIRPDPAWRDQVVVIDVRHIGEGDDPSGGYLNRLTGKVGLTTYYLGLPGWAGVLEIETHIEGVRQKLKINIRKGFCNDKS